MKPGGRPGTVRESFLDPVGRPGTALRSGNLKAAGWFPEGCYPPALKLQRQDGETPAARVDSLIGSLESGTPDLAENHRAYVLESLKHGR